MKHVHAHPQPRFPYGRRLDVPQELFAAAVVASNLSCGYARHTPILSQLHFTLKEGTINALVGPNGAGKSTILKTLAGLLPACSGKAEIYGLEPGLCHHRTAYLPQRTELEWQFPISVAQFVLAGRYVHLGWLKRPRKIDHELTHRMLDRLGLADCAEQSIGELSGGRQQRAMIGRALVQGSELILLDEPLNHLDAETRHDLLTLFRELANSGKTLLVATHEYDRPEEIFDQVLHVRAGTVSL